MNKALFMLLVLVLSFFAPNPHVHLSADVSVAQCDAQWSMLPQAHAAEDDTCTKDWKGEGGGGEGDGLLTQIVDYIKNVIDDTTQKLFNGITSHSAFISALYAAFTLFVAFFGVAFMFGIVPLTFGQALTRLLKIGVILSVVSPGGWAFFHETAVKFFNDGTDELIDTVIGIATGDSSGAKTGKPFAKIDEMVSDALSPEMMVATITSFLTGPMGPAMGGMMGIGMMAFIQMLVKALRVYCISLVAKALLFGLAPIFLSFMLFEKTKHMFSGWVNQLVNFSLQPIMLFAFLAFFVVLIDSSIQNILGTDICWTNVEQLSGDENKSMFWRFTDKNGEPTGSPFSWQGLVKCIQAGGGGCDDFPVSVLDILTFLIISHLAYRFSDVVVNIAAEISASTLSLDKLRSGLSDMVKGSGEVGGNAGRQASQNPNPVGARPSGAA